MIQLGPSKIANYIWFFAFDISIFGGYAFGFLHLLHYSKKIDFHSKFTLEGDQEIIGKNKKMIQCKIIPSHSNKTAWSPLCFISVDVFFPFSTSLQISLRCTRKAEYWGLRSDRKWLFSFNKKTNKWTIFIWLVAYGMHQTESGWKRDWERERERWPDFKRGRASWTGVVDCNDDR